MILLIVSTILSGEYGYSLSKVEWLPEGILIRLWIQDKAQETYFETAFLSVRLPVLEVVDPTFTAELSLVLF